MNRRQVDKVCLHTALLTRGWQVWVEGELTQNASPGRTDRSAPILWLGVNCEYDTAQFPSQGFSNPNGHQVPRGSYENADSDSGGCGVGSGAGRENLPFQRAPGPHE